MKARSRLLTMSLLAPLVLVAHPASASPPTGACPPAFQGPFTFAEIIATWPPGPDVTDPEGILASYDMNADRRLCVRPAQPQSGVSILVVDNLVRSR